jgi:hypothetical protein
VSLGLEVKWILGRQGVDFEARIKTGTLYQYIPPAFLVAIPLAELLGAQGGQTKGGTS